MRVFVPATLPALRRVVASGGLEPPLFGCSVTPDLRAWLATEDAELLEYAALTAAAGESLQLLAAEPAVVRRRAVIVVEIADQQVIPDPAAGLSAVRVATGARMCDVVAVHVDDAAFESVVAEAAHALDAADTGDEAAAQVVRRLDDQELLWYAVQEIPELL